MATLSESVTKDIICEIEALHVLTTGNFIDYTEESIDSSLESWTTPYLKPVILHHKDQDGEIIGRVLKAEKRQSVLLENSCALVLTVRISNEKAKQGIIDKRYLTTSIGVTSTDVECSICHKPVQKNKPCGHILGKSYHGTVCTWKVNNMTAKEISFVIVPADSYAQVIHYWYEDHPETPTSIFKERNEKMKNTELNEHEQNQQDIVLKEQMFQEKEQTYIQEITSLKEQITQNENKIQTLETSLQESLEEKTSLLANASVLETKVTNLESQLTNEKLLREAAEKTVHDLQENEKSAIVTQIISLREKLDLRALEKDSFKNKDYVQLQEMLTDLQADLEFKESKKVEELKDAKVQNTTIPLKESEKVSHVTLTHISDIMKNVL